MKTVFLRILEADDKATALLEAVRESERAMGQQRFELDPRSFASVPRSPFAYWAPPTILRAFSTLSAYESGGRTALQGASTCDDFRYVRAWYEVLPTTDMLQQESAWVGFARGGRFSRFYADVSAIVRWSKARTSFHGFIGRSGRWNPKPVSADHYLQPGITWPLRGSVFSSSMLPSGCAFSVGGKVALAPRDEIPFLAAVFNSAAFNAAISLFAGKIGGFQYETGIINQAPVPWPSTTARAKLSGLARSSWSRRRMLDTRTETSHAFTLPALLQVAGADIATRSAAWSQHVRAVEAELAMIQAEIDERCFALYALDDVDQRTIIQGFSGTATKVMSSGDADEAEAEAEAEAEEGAGEDPDEYDSAVDAANLAWELVSWAVGVAFGRFDMRLAINAPPLSAEPDPFDPLPACSPGMLTGGDDVPLTTPPTGYPLAFPEAGVLVDDLGHAQDLPTAIRGVFEAVFGAGADSAWNDVAALVDSKDHDVRAWLAGSFFEFHLKRYSKSHRKAPIFWQLGTPSGRYSVWLYAHRLTRDTFFQLQNEVVGAKLIHEEQQLTSLVENAGDRPSVPERKEIATQGALVEELRAMLGEIKRVAPLWNPKLDDGVVLTMAPLWRLVPAYKPWQKELKAKWDELAAGKYDWAHLAMHLWPERVVPKCATDRSLAIAHGLEDIFWTVGAGGKWKVRATPTRPVGDIVRERSSSAVKAALASLLDAPGALGSGRARGRRAASPVATEGGSR